MNSAQDFLLAAQQCEIESLEQLRFTCKLVAGLSELIHCLQRERGVSNVYLGSRGQRFNLVLKQQLTESCKAENTLRASFSLLAQHHGSVRLFSRIASVLHGFESLAALRMGIDTLQLSPSEATASYSRLIAGLLAIVFEAADTAADPEITQVLVAMFNFMQGKELSGQERAAGASGFTLGFFSHEEQQRILYLIEAQDRCFDIFAQFAPAAVLGDWHKLKSSPLLNDINKLRQIGRKANETQTVPSDMGELWFELTTQRIDEMKLIESRLADSLMQLSEYKIVEARADLHNHKDTLATITGLDNQALVSRAVLLDPPAAELDETYERLPIDVIKTKLGHSIFDLVQAQARRLQSVSDELGAAKKALNERKQIERAKGLLMIHRGLSEDQAYKMLRQAAMDQSRRVADVAETVLGLLDLLPVKRKG